MLHHRLRAASGARQDGGGGGIPTSGLVAWYTMDNVAGSTLIDETGTYNGAISGATQVSGIIGQALEFDGTTSDQVAFSQLGLSNITASLWVYLDAMSGAQYPILANWNSRALSYILDVYDGQIRWIVDNGSSHVILSGGAVAISNWYHVVVYNVAGSQGIIVNNGSPITGPSILNLRFPSGQVFFGRKGDDPIPRMDGRIDQVRIYNRSLSVAEITALYNEA